MAVSAYAGALTVVADVKSRLKITDSAQDDFLQTLVNAASRRLESLTNRLLKQRTYTGVLFNGNGRQAFTGDPSLDSLTETLASGEGIQQSAWGRRLETPLGTITSITLDGTAQTIGNDPAVYDVQVITLGRPSGLSDCLYRGSGWTRGVNNILITYQGGFSPVPEDLAEACILTVMAWYMDKDRGYIRLQSFSAQGESVTLEKTAIPTIVRELIAPFIRPAMIGI